MIQPVGAATDRAAATSPAAGRTQVRTEDFLRLLTLQLKYQNPLEPMKETEFVTQLAQFSELEALQNLQSTVSAAVERQGALYALGQGVGLVGRRVVVRRDGQPVEGTVERLRLDQGRTRLVVNGSEFDLTEVVEVRG